MIYSHKKAGQTQLAYPPEWAHTQPETVATVSGQTFILHIMLSNRREWWMTTTDLDAALRYRGERVHIYEITDEGHLALLTTNYPPRKRWHHE